MAHVTRALGLGVRRSGWWTLAGTWSILLVLAVTSGGFATLLPALGAFLTGRLDDVSSGSDEFSALFPNAAAAVVLMVPLGLALLALVNLVHGVPAGDGPVHQEELWRRRQPRNDFFTVILLILVEELYARGLFLGLLTRIPFLDGTAAYYGLFLVGNLTWALAHLGNYRDPYDRTALRVLPQFGSGIVITVIYVNFGLLGALLVHVAYDMLLFCLDRRGRVTIVTAMVVGGYLAAGLVGWFTLDRPVTDLLGWLYAEDSLALPGWESRDYSAIVLLAFAALAVVGELLLYDNAGSRRQLDPLVVFPVAIVKALLTLGFFTVLGYVIDGVGPRILVVAIVLVMVSAVSSTGSGVARVFWVRMPVIALALGAVTALPFWSGVALLTLLGLLTGLEDLPR